MSVKLYGVDMLVAGISRNDLIGRLSEPTFGVQKVFFDNEDFDAYVDLIGVQNIAVVRPIPPQGGLDFKVEIEMLAKAPVDAIARELSKSDCLAAYPENNSGVSNYIVYYDGQFSFKAHLDTIGVTGSGDSIYRLTRSSTEGGDRP